jgi:hypothetical protein
LIWSVPLSGEVLSIGTLPDFNGDHKCEIVAGTTSSVVSCFSGSNGATFWSYPYDRSGNVSGVAVVQDYNNDRVPEVTAISQSGVINCLRGSLTGNFSPVRSWLAFQ